MWTCSSKSDLRARIGTAARPIVLVPTMGALHPGHASLIALAREKAGPEGTVIVSVFVNPIQFDRASDLEHYPRPIEADLAVCEEHGADGVFLPDNASMYAQDRSVTVIESGLPNISAARPDPATSMVSAPWCSNSSTSPVAMPPCSVKKTSNNSPSSAA